MVFKPRLDMQRAPDGGALEAKALFAGGWFLGVAAIQREPARDGIEFIKVGNCAKRVWQRNGSDNGPAAIADAGTHDPNANGNLLRNDLRDGRTVGAMHREETRQWELNHDSVCETAATKRDFKSISRIP